MVRQIIHIDKEKCNGCGACADACHEGAIAMIDGKAELIRDDYCDGMGDCLPNCPTGAITFENREAADYDRAAVEENMKKRAAAAQNNAEHHDHSAVHMAANAAAGHMVAHHHEGGCPGAKVREMNRRAEGLASAAPCTAPVQSQLSNWPVQIKLAPIQTSYFNGAKLLIAADCTAYAYANFHQEFIRGKVTLIGCPKLDAVDYSEKLTEIIRNNDIKEVTIIRMEVPCCGGLEMAAKKALQASGKFIPWRVVTIGIDGNILD